MALMLAVTVTTTLFLNQTLRTPMLRMVLMQVLTLPLALAPLQPRQAAALIQRQTVASRKMLATV